MRVEGPEMLLRFLRSVLKCLASQNCWETANQNVFVLVLIGLWYQSLIFKTKKFEFSQNSWYSTECGIPRNQMTWEPFRVLLNVSSIFSQFLTPPPLKVGDVIYGRPLFSNPLIAREMAGTCATSNKLNHLLLAKLPEPCLSAESWYYSHPLST